jgi:hypothetical protein
MPPTASAAAVSFHRLARVHFLTAYVVGSV